jgi:hypothetical protein
LPKAVDDDDDDDDDDEGEEEVEAVPGSTVTTTEDACTENRLSTASCGAESVSDVLVPPGAANLDVKSLRLRVAKAVPLSPSAKLDCRPTVSDVMACIT